MAAYKKTIIRKCFLFMVTNVYPAKQSIAGEKKFSRTLYNWWSQIWLSCWDATGTSKQRVKEIIRDDRWVTVDSVAAAMMCSHGFWSSENPQWREKFHERCRSWTWSGNVVLKTEQVVLCSKFERTMGQVHQYWWKLF